MFVFGMGCRLLMTKAPNRTSSVCRSKRSRRTLQRLFFPHRVVWRYDDELFKLNRYIWQGPDERKIECVAKSIVTFLGFPTTFFNPWYCKFQTLISLHSPMSCIQFRENDTYLSPTIQSLTWHPYIFVSISRRLPMLTPLGRTTPVCIRTCSLSDKYRYFAAVIPCYADVSFPFNQSYI